MSEQLTSVYKVSRKFKNSVLMTKIYFPSMQIFILSLSFSLSENVQSPEPSGTGAPPGNYRQGYCSCCQVHYINLETHLTSVQHRQASTCHRNRCSTSIMLDRFLQDVQLYHPQKYHDTRPTYDDIPEVIRLPASLVDPSHALLPTDTEGKEHIVASRAILNVDNLCASEFWIASPSKNNSNKVPIAPLRPETFKIEGRPPKNNVPSHTISNTNQNALYSAIDTIPHSSPFSTLHLGSPRPLTAKKCKCPDAPQLMLSLESDTKRIEERKRYGLCTKCLYSELTGSPQRVLQNRSLDSQGSCFNLTSGLLCGKQSGLKSQGQTDHILRTQMLSSHLTNARISLGSHHGAQPPRKCLQGCGEKSSVDEIIEEVIWKYCYGFSPRKSLEKDDESVSSVKVHSVICCTEGSSLSFDWEMPMQSVDDQPKTLIKNVDLLQETNVSLGEDYTSKLTSVLGAHPVKEEKHVKAESEEAILTALPHVPPSFVGKTWSQVMYEDDLKIEALVKQFKKGKFHCYFENGATNAGRKSKRKLKSEEKEEKVEAQTDNWKEAELANALPSFHEVCHDSDIPSVISEQVIKPEVGKPARKTWRLASRCQIVKVSHGTQTSLYNYQLPKRKAVKTEVEPEWNQDFPYEVGDKTPEMKTRMCALKLPESYTKILTPVQPKTMVYVLSHPDAKQRKAKPACISKQGRNQYSTESRDSVNYKYKQSPLKYYDPLTNRILKTPPRNTLGGMGIKGACVRKLFRSLSSDVNVHKLDLDQKESTASKKSLSSCSFASLYVDSAKGSDISSGLQESVSSSSTDQTDCLKSQTSSKPYGHISISPSNACKVQVKNDILLTPLITKTRNHASRSKKCQLLKRRNVKTSRAKPNVIKELKKNTRFNLNRREMVRIMGGPSSGKQLGTRRQPNRKSSIAVGKSIVPFVKAYRPRERTAQKSLRSNLQVREHVQTLLKSEFISLKPTKRKPKMAKPVVKNTGQRKLRDRTCKATRDRNITVTRSRACPKRKASETVSHAISSRGTKFPESSSRSHRNQNTRKRVR